MKLFVEEKGLFSIKVPFNWNCRYITAKQKVIYTFENFETDLGTFQISYLKDTKILKKIKKAKKLPDNKYTAIKYKFVEDFFESDSSIDTLTWSMIVENYLFIVSFIYKSSRRNEQLIIDEIKNAKLAFSSLRYIHPKFRDKEIVWDRFGRFLTGISASGDLSNMAMKKGAFIETVILLANQIDALLRLSIILKRQIINKNQEIDKELIYQAVDDRPIMERKVYDIAKKEGIVDETVFDELNTLYNERNKVVHRYIITDLKTEDVLEIALKYNKLFFNICKVLDELEVKQMEVNQGITGELPVKSNAKDLYENEVKRVIYSVKEKHGKINWDVNNQ